MAHDGLSIDAVWDIETEDWDTYVVGAIWTRDNGVVVCRHEDDLAEHLLSLPPRATAWAHAGGRFDVLWLLDWCRRNGSIPNAQIRMSGSSIASLAIAQGPVLRDSARLIPMSLKEASTMFPGTRKEQLALPCRCGRDCGGYCSIRRKMSRADRAKVEQYLVADVESLRDTLVSLMAYAAENDIAIGGTVASSAWATAKETCGLEDSDWDVQQYMATRDGYYGGLTAVGRTRAKKVYRFDRASAYPAALQKPVPVGKPSSHAGKAALKAWNHDRPGAYFATVIIPEQMCPPLPVRHGSRLVYPHGKVAGTWPSAELQHAVDKHDAKIERVDACVVWPREEAILKPHVTRCFALRSKAETKALKVWLKFLANSLTGAFAQDPEQDHIALGDYADNPIYEQVGRYDWIWRRKSFRISSRAHVQWAMTLTGDARVELKEEIVHADDAWCYSDTDSVIATEMLTRNVGKELGQWQFEGAATDYVAIAPKVYTYIDKGTRFARAKGIPDAVKRWDQIHSGARVKIDRGVKSLLVAARGDNIFERQNTHRALSPREGWCGARILDGEKTRAPSVAELAGLPK